jgi:hypothetical protein
MSTVKVAAGPLPPIDPSITELALAYKCLTSLPTLPPGLKTLSCPGNLLTQLPNLPSTLKYLNCTNNKLTELPPLSPNLKDIEFNAGNNIKVTRDIYNIWANATGREKLSSFSPENQQLIKTLQKAEKVEKLRMQKEPAPLQFTPTKAYIINGHGNEGNDTFIVPKNCIIVVKGHSSENRLEIIIKQNFQRLCALDQTILKDPIKYQNKIVKAVGSVLIFTEGMECPNFEYGLLSKWNPKMQDPIQNDNFIHIGKSSGLIDVDTKMMCKHDDMENIKLYDKASIIDNNLKNELIEMYNGSVFPTKEQISNLINGLGPIATLRSFLESPKFELFEYSTQTELLQVRGETAGRPGVYYNFVCRGSEKSDMLYNHNGREHNLLDADLLEAHSITPDLKSVRNQNISEALMRAKALHQYDETSKTPFGMAQGRIDTLLHGKNGTGRKRTKRKKNIRKKKTRKYR